jgi:hypothetical protein
MERLALSRVESLGFPIPTTMLDSTSLNTSLLEVIISSKNECVFIYNLSNLTLQIIINALWGSMNAGFICPAAWNYSRYTSAWRMYLRCGIEESSSPGIICIVCHKVLCHPLADVICSMGTNLLAKAYIVHLNIFKESEVTELTTSTIDETAPANLMRQGS